MGMGFGGFYNNYLTKGLTITNLKLHQVHFNTKYYILNRFLKLHAIFILLVGMVSLKHVAAQGHQRVQQQFVFEQISIDDGLSNNCVNAICQDHHGYMWFVTNSGLNKYNGLTNTVYEGPKDGLPAAYANDVFCDSEGKLWVGTTEGLFVFDVLNNRFQKDTIMFLHETLNVYDIEEDTMKNLWFATSCGLYKYDIKSHTSHNWEGFLSPGQLLPSDSVDLLMVEGDKIWLSFFHKNIGILDIVTGHIKYFDMPKTQKTGNLQVEAFFKDKLGYVWIGTYNHGLYVFSPFDSTFAHQWVDPTNPYSSRVRVFFEDIEGHMFVGTRGGLYQFDRNNSTYRLYAHIKHKFSTLSNNSILCSFTDNSGGLWLGTRYGGVQYSNMERKPFTHYKAGDKDPFFLNHSSVFAFTEDSKGNIYVATEKGVNIFDTQTHTFEYLTSQGKEGYRLSYDDVKALSVDQNDNIWIATNNGGLNYFDPRTKKVTHFRSNQGDEGSLWSDKVYYAINDNNGNLWLLSNPDRENSPSTLSKLEPGEKIFSHYHENFFGGLWVKDDGNLLIGGIGGFYLYDVKADKFIFKQDSGIGNVLCVFQDVKGIVWIGSNLGLSRYNGNDGSFTHYSVETGYPIGEVAGFLSDDKANLWVATNAGLIKLIGILGNPSSKEYKVFTKNDGLQSKQFNANAYMKSKNGQLYFGGINGFNSFDPDKIIENPYKPKIVLSGLIIDNQEVKMNQKVYGKVVTRKLIPYADKFTIAPQVRLFTIRFDAIHYTNASGNKYKYMLEGFDLEWNYSNAYNNYVTYTDLPPNDYIFKVYALNSDGIASEKAVAVNIKVLPHIWETLWFKFGIALCLIVLALVIYKIRMYKLHAQKILLAKKVKEKTKALEKSYLQLQERQNEILAQNEEIKTQNDEIFQQNEEIVAQRDEIKRKNDELEVVFESTKTLNEFGKKITSVLSFEEINRMIYRYLSSLMDTSVFGLGIFNDKDDAIVFEHMVENGKQLPVFFSELKDHTSMAAYCFRNQESVRINDFDKEFGSYISDIFVRSTRRPKSLIYVPLTVNNKRIGVFTVQSYNYNAYNDQDLFVFESLASFIAIALDNTWAYDQLKLQKDEIEKHRTNLSKMVYERTQQLEKAKIKAEESDRLKSSFLTNMSHEIRTPLNAIIGFVDVMKNNEVSEEEKQKLFSIIQSSGFYLSNLINDIIDFSKIEADQLDFQVGPVLVKPMLDELYQTFTEELKRHNDNNGHEVGLALDTKYPTGANVNADPIRFRQVMNNLLGNAIKFTSKGSVQFGIHSIDDHYSTFFVKDTGIGIEKKNFEIIFDRFRKIEENVDNLYRGTGLGLAISKFIITNMGGDIWVESEYGKGSCFYFKLPNAIPEERMQKNVLAQKEPSVHFPDWKNKNLLIVEDEDSNYLLLESMLRKTNVNIYRAKDGAQAIDMFKEKMEFIDLVLMDIKLPVISGIDAAKEIKSFKKTVPIVAQTAHAMASEEHKIRNSGFDEYLTKPIVHNRLIDVISMYL
jgi:signal transduction histidine kinase/ligand-binding sensor domain-containing protein/CheY-like chemotaxis protein